jgi:spore coat polysaccharide biosynthesis protein SpsF (cytidylyltransferase family)
MNLLKDFSDFRWALDYENDMKLIREIISRIKNRPILMNDIISLLENNPKLKEINRINH